MIRKLFNLFIILLMTIYAHNFLWAYDGEVHSRLNEESTRYLQLDVILKNQLDIPNGIDTTLKNYRKTKSILKWLAYGGETEDYGWLGKKDVPRTCAFNHFHDPLKPWDEAGLDDYYSLMYTANYFREPVSPLLWGTKPRTARLYNEFYWRLVLGQGQKVILFLSHRSRFCW